MTEEEFRSLADAGYNLIPVVHTALADVETPLSVYLKLANRPYSYLLESVHGGERFGRYSFVGLPAATRLRITRYDILVETEGEATETFSSDDPLGFVEHYLKRFKAAPVTGLPRFCGGLAGYFGYDIVRYVEPHLAGHWKETDSNTPDVLLLVTTELAVIDNLTGQLHFIVYAKGADPHGYAKARDRVEELRRQLRQPVVLPEGVTCAPVGYGSNMSESDFEQMVEKARQYIRVGDVMQVVLSQRLSQPFRASSLALYRALRQLNPSPYMFYYHFDSFQVVGASPEILVRLEDGTVTVRPIAGTRPRGKTVEQDHALEKELLADPKEIAEHVMLIDLGRNDVGRIAETGSVEVTERMTVERYSHVMHIVSHVEGRLRPGLGAMDVLKAAFPAGTLSGAPKVRAMEIIDELEHTRRGVYGGAVGYLGFDGNMDMAIAIRTGVVQDGMLHVQAGAGIVADSVPASEFQETLNKAQAVLRAARVAEQGLE